MNDGWLVSLVRLVRLFSLVSVDGSWGPHPQLNAEPSQEELYAPIIPVQLKQMPAKRKRQRILVHEARQLRCGARGTSGTSGARGIPSGTWRLGGAPGATRSGGCPNGSNGDPKGGS